MPTSEQHIDRARRNQKFAEHLDLDTTEFRDWVVTGYFYSTLHWIDAYLVREKKKTEDGHAFRNTQTNNLKELTPISRPYRKLYSYSRNVRYELVDFTAEQIRHDVLPKVKEIQEYMEGLLAKRSGRQSS